MTPAIEALRKLEIAFKVHEYVHDSSAESFSLETAAALHVNPDRIFKTLVARLDNGKLVMGMVPGSAHLSLKALAAAAGAKRAEMADPAAAERATGYVVGGISPLSPRKRLAVFIDRSALDHATIFVSAGRRGMQLELAPADLIAAVAATAASIAAPGPNA